MSQFILWLKIIWHSRELRAIAPLLLQALQWYIDNQDTPSDERHDKAAEMLGKIVPAGAASGITTATTTDIPATPGGA